MPVKLNNINVVVVVDIIDAALLHPGLLLLFFQIYTDSLGCCGQVLNFARISLDSGEVVKREERTPIDRPEKSPHRVHDPYVQRRSKLLQRSADLSNDQGGDSFDPDALDKALRQYKQEKGCPFRVSSLDTSFSSNEPHISFPTERTGEEETPDFNERLAAWLHRSDGALRYPLDAKKQKERRSMRTVSRDDYLLARGANPRTGVVTPGSHLGHSPFDEHELLRQRGVTPPSKWRLKGDEWVSLGLGEPTPIPSPPADLKHSLDSRNNNRRPPKLAAQRIFTLPDHQDDPYGVKTLPGQFPKSMSDRQQADFQKSVERVKRHSKVMAESPKTPPRETKTTEQMRSPPSPLKKQSPGSQVLRKAIGSPMKSPEMATTEMRNTSTDTVINRPEVSQVDEFKSATDAVLEYYSADDVGNREPTPPPPPPAKGEPREEESKFAGANHDQTQNYFLGLSKGEWIEDIPSNILDLSKKESEAKPGTDQPPPQNQSIGNNRIQSPSRPVVPPVSQKTYGSVPRLPPRPFMSNALGNRTMPFPRRGGAPESGPPFPISKSWSQPYQFNHQQPMSAHQRPAVLDHRPYVLLRQVDAHHEDIFPAPRPGMVRNMRQRIDMRNTDFHGDRLNPGKRPIYNTSHLTTNMFTPTTTTTTATADLMSEGLALPRTRPRGTSRPMLPPRAEGTVSVPQVSPYRRAIASTDVNVNSRHAQTNNGGGTSSSSGELFPDIPQPPGITITTASPERPTRNFAADGTPRHDRTQCLHQQMNPRLPGPTICPCNLTSPHHHRHHLGPAAQGLGTAGSTLMLGGPARDHGPSSGIGPGNVMHTAAGDDGSVTAAANGHLQASPIIGIDLSTADPDFLHHDRCCPTCCAMGCHGGCLGHDNPPSRTHDRNAADCTSGRENAPGVGFRHVLRNSLRFRRSVKVTRKKQQQEFTTDANGHTATGIQQQEEEEEEITIAELESPLPWEDHAPVTLLPVGEHSSSSSSSAFASLWSKAKAKSAAFLAATATANGSTSNGFGNGGLQSFSTISNNKQPRITSASSCSPSTTTTPSVFDTSLVASLFETVILVPYSLAAAYLAAHPQLRTQGRRLAWKLVEMAFQVLATARLLLRWWLLTRHHHHHHHQQVGLGRKRPPPPPPSLRPNELVFLASEMARSLVYCVVLFAVALLAARLLALGVAVVEAVVWLVSGIAWAVRGFGLFG